MAVRLMSAQAQVRDARERDSVHPNIYKYLYMYMHIDTNTYLKLKLITPLNFNNNLRKMCKLQNDLFSYANEEDS